MKVSNLSPLDSFNNDDSLLVYSHKNRDMFTYSGSQLNSWLTENKTKLTVQYINVVDSTIEVPITNQWVICTKTTTATSVKLKMPTVATDQQVVNISLNGLQAVVNVANYDTNQRFNISFRYDINSKLWYQV